MKVGVIHNIADPISAQERGQALFEEMEGIELLQFVPSTDFTMATCVWEADTIEDVRDIVDPTLGEASTNTYFPVLTEQAVNLP